MPPSVSDHESNTAACPSITVAPSLSLTRSSFIGSIRISFLPFSIATSFLYSLHSRPCRCHVAVHEIIVTALFFGDRRHIFKPAYIIDRQPTVLTGYRIPFRARLVITAQQSVHIELGKIQKPLFLIEKRTADFLLPTHEPGAYRVLDKFN